MKVRHNPSMERGYIIFYRIGIHCEIQAVPFLRPFSCKRAELERAQLSQMQPGEPSEVIRERVIAARRIQEERLKLSARAYSRILKVAHHRRPRRLRESGVDAHRRSHRIP